MIITRADVVNFGEFVAEMKKMRQLEMHQKFSSEEIKKFSTQEISLKSVLQNIKPFSYFTTSGDRILGFKLDSKDARVNNISKDIEINVKSGNLFSKGIKQNVILKLENLFLSGFRFDSLPSKDLKKAEVEIDVTLKLHNGKEKITKTLVYNPETNKFFE
jgi:hypothetical protein